MKLYRIIKVLNKHEVLGSYQSPHVT